MAGATQSFFARALEPAVAPEKAPTALAVHSDGSAAGLQDFIKGLADSRVALTAAVSAAVFALVFVAAVLFKPPFAYSRGRTLYEPKRPNAGLVLVPLLFAAAVALANPARTLATKFAQASRERSLPGAPFPTTA